MSTPRPLWSTGQAAAQRFNRAYPGLQGGRRAGLAPVQPRLAKRRRRVAVDWIQPANVFAGATPIRRSMQNTTRQTPVNAFNGVTGATLSTSSPLLVDVTGVHADGLMSVCFGAALVEFDAAKLPQVWPDIWPPGATDVEFESPQGTLISGNMSGLMRDVPPFSGEPPYEGLVSVGGPTTPYEVSGATFQPSWHTPGDLAVPRFATRTLNTAGTTSWSVDFGPGDLSADAVYQVAFFAESHAAAVQPATTVTAEATVNCSYTYRPPRYRFIY